MALQAAVEAGLDMPGRADAVAMLRAAPSGQVRGLLLATALRFDGQSVRGLPRRDAFVAMVMAGVDVSTEELAEIAGDPTDEELGVLVRSRSPAARCTALLASASLPVWSLALEDAIVAATVDPEPSVRAAAYRALASRDADVWACAWLLREAEFDPDASVRELAPRRSR